MLAIDSPEGKALARCNPIARVWMLSPRLALRIAARWRRFSALPLEAWQPRQAVFCFDEPIQTAEGMAARDPERRICGLNLNENRRICSRLTELYSSGFTQIDRISVQGHSCAGSLDISDKNDNHSITMRRLAQEVLAARAHADIRIVDLRACQTAMRDHETHRNTARHLSRMLPQVFVVGYVTTIYDGENIPAMGPWSPLRSNGAVYLNGIPYTGPQARDILRYPKSCEVPDRSALPGGGAGGIDPWAPDDDEDGLTLT